MLVFFVIETFNEVQILIKIVIILLITVSCEIVVDDVIKRLKTSTDKVNKINSLYILYICLHVYMYIPISFHITLITIRYWIKLYSSYFGS